MKTILVNDTSNKPHVGCKLTMIGLKQAIERSGMRLWRSLPTHKPWAIYKNDLKKTDCVIVNGEGVMHGDKEKAVSLASIGEFCKEKKIPVYLVNTVFQSSNVRIINGLKWFDGIFARESTSRNNLWAVGLDAEVAPDAIFSVKYGNWLVRPKQRCDIVVTDSVNLGVTADICTWAERHADSASPLSVKLTKPKLRASRSIFLTRLIDRHKEPTGTKNSDLDSFFVRKKNISDFFSELLSAHLVVTGRFHVICLCLAFRVPFLALPSNTWKNESFLKDMGLQDRFLTSDALLELNCREAIGKADKESMPSLLEGCRQNVDAVFRSIYQQVSRK